LIAPANSVEPFAITSPLPPIVTTPLAPPDSVVIRTNGPLAAEASNVPSTLTLLELEISPLPDNASVPPEIVVAPV
jgi:hypothetical protein